MKLKGVQLPLLAPRPKLAYRALTANGSAVLCDRHLEELRSKRRASLTGETFRAALCDRCVPEEEL